jgi:hypothetical protein
MSSKTVLLMVQLPLHTGAHLNQVFVQVFHPGVYLGITLVAIVARAFLFWLAESTRGYDIGPRSNGCIYTRKASKYALADSRRSCVHSRKQGICYT